MGDVIMFEFLKRKKKDKPVVGKISKDELGGTKSPETTTEVKDEGKQFSPKPIMNTDSPKEKTLEEKAIEMIKNSALRKYYDLMESTFEGKSTRDIVNGIDDEIEQIFSGCGIEIDGSESIDEKLDYARRVFDHVTSDIAYDKVLTQFMRVASKNIYHDDINRELMKEVYYGLRNHAGTCLSDACTISYMFEKIGIDSKVIGLGDHAMVEVNLDGKTLYCDSTYEKGILNGSDSEAIMQGKGYGAGFMQDQTLLTDRNYQKEFELPKMSLILEANARKEELDNSCGQTFYYTIDTPQEK